MLGQIQPADKIVVAGGGEVGIETAAHLGMQEHQVTVVEMKDILGEELIAPVFRYHLTNSLPHNNLRGQGHPSRNREYSSHQSLGHHHSNRFLHRSKKRSVHSTKHPAYPQTAPASW